MNFLKWSAMLVYDFWEVEMLLSSSPSLPLAAGFAFGRSVILSHCIFLLMLIASSIVSCEASVAFKALNNIVEYLL